MEQLVILQRKYTKMRLITPKCVAQPRVRKVLSMKSKEVQINQAKIVRRSIAHPMMKKLPDEK